MKLCLLYREPQPKASPVGEVPEGRRGDRLSERFVMSPLRRLRRQLPYRGAITNQ